MNGTDARELLASAVDRIERSIARADRDARRLVIDVALWPTPLIAAVVAVLRRRGRQVRKTTTLDESRRVRPAIEITLPLAQRELTF